MKRFQKQLTAFIAVLLVLCSVLTSCASTKPNENDTTGGSQGTEEHTHPSSETTGTQQQPCTHASTTLVGKKDSTCAVEGYTGDTVCSACGEIVSKGTAIPLIAHKWGEGVQTKNPTCIDTGVLTITCSGCGDTKTETVPTVAHDDKFHDALDGSHNHTCTTCTMNKNEKHNPVDAGVAYPATCLEGAYTLMTCADCDGVYKVYSQEEADKATGHQWSAWETLLEASCSATGQKTRTCSACGETEAFELPIDPSAHSFVCVNPTVKPTCAESAIAQHKCSGCDTVKTETLKATGNHSYVLQEDQGDGWTRHICSVCDDEIAKFDASTVTVAEVKAEDIPTDTTLAVATQNASISFPAKTVSQLTAEVDKKVSIAADVVGETDKNALIESATNLKEEEKERLKDVDIFDFGVMVGDTPVSSFDAAVTVTMPYTLKEGEEAEGILIWYVADDGTTEEVEATYNAETKTVTFSVEHFSFYAVAYKETQAMRCKRGEHDYQIVGEPVPATCDTHGYTKRECTGCKKVLISDFVEKTDHAYGALVEAVTTCTEGGWSYKECENCGHILNVTYVRAKGHNPDAVATCTTPSTCTTCNTVITPAKGHSYTEWETVVEPTDVNSGLRRRYCLSCGKVEEMKLAASGNIETLKFESYEQLLETIVTEALNLGNGTIELDVSMQGFVYNFDITVNSDENNFILLLEGTQTETYEDGETETEEISLLYRNGVIIFSNIDDEIFGTDIISVAALPFDIFLDYVEQTFDYLNPMVEMIFGQSKEMLASYIELLGAELNAALKLAGIEYTVEDLETVLDSLETVYTYCVLKLGYHTNLEMQDGVRVPTKADLHNVLNALMTSTENADGSKTYTWDITELLEAVNTIVAWVEERIETPVSEVLYELLAESLTASYPDLTDWNACVAKIKATFPGTMTVKNMVDLLITVLEENEICTLDELYAIINTIAEQFTGEAFDCKTFVEAYYDQTLNDMVVAMTGEEGVTAEMMYDSFNQQFTETLLGEIEVDLRGDIVPLDQLLAMVQQSLTALKPEADASITLDAKGNLLDVSFNESIFAVGTDESGATAEMEISSVHFHLEHNDTVKVEIPEELKPLTDSTVNATFDQNGNLVVGGLNPDMTYDFLLNGNYQAALKDMLTKDEEASKSFGFPVYTLDKDLWRDTAPVQSVAVVDGKYYSMTYTWLNGERSVGDSVPLADLLAGSDNLLPDEGDTPTGFIKSWDEQTGMSLSIPAYETVFGLMWQENGVWLYSSDFSCNLSYSYSDDGTVCASEIVYNPYYEWEYQSYDDLYLNILDNRNMSYEVEIDGKQYRTVTLHFSTEANPDETVLSLSAYIDGEKVYLISWHREPSVSGYSLGEEITELDEYDFSYSSGSRYVNLIDKDGNVEYVEIETLETYKKVPTFYAKIDANTFTRVTILKSLSEDLLNEYEQITLPDGKTFYKLPDDIVNDKYYSQYDGQSFVPGYVKTESGLYVPTVIVKDFNNEILDIVYREASSSILVDYDAVYDLAQYITRNNDGTYTVSAQLIEQLKKSCTDEGDSFAIMLIGQMTANGKDYSVRHAVMSYVNAETLSFGSNTSEAIYIPWYEWFENSGSGISSGYTMIANKDGSLTITFPDGKKVNNIRYETNDRVALDDFLIYNEDMSQQAGMDIYGNLFRLPNTYNTVVLVDGKYYTYSHVTEYVAEFTDELSKVIDASWRIDSMYLRYTLTADDKELPVYDARISFQQPGNSFSFGCFLTVQDGDIYVLKQVSEQSNGGLVCEEIVPADEYFASLKVVINENSYSYGYEVIVNGMAGTMSSKYVSLYETDAQGNIITDEEGNSTPIVSGNISVFVDAETRQNHFIATATNKGSHLKLGAEYIPSAVVDSSYDYSNEYLNGEFTFVNLTFVSYEYFAFVRLAGAMYRYDGWNGYQSQSKSEEEFLKEFADFDWIYAHVAPGQEFDFDGEWIARDKEGNIINKPEGWMNVSHELIAVEDDGTKIYEVYGFFFNEDTVTITELEDDCVLYSKDGVHFVKGPDGRYVFAYSVMDRDGNESFVCELEDSYIEGWQLSDYKLLEKYITQKADGSIVLSAEFIDFIEPLEDFYMYIETNQDSIHISRESLMQYFAK